MKPDVKADDSRVANLLLFAVGAGLKPQLSASFFLTLKTN
jgi:hypothetical protein